MANRKHSDARRFDFCTRCLEATGPGRELAEHHLHGRKNHHTAIVFVCNPCHDAVEDANGPIAAESAALAQKRNLLVQSRALRWIIRNWKPVVAGLEIRNTNGVGMSISPGSTGWQPPFGAVGSSGRKYYFIPPDHRDEFVETPVTPTPAEDGVGEPAGGASWIRFRGEHDNVLNRFLDLHAAQGSLGVALEILRQW